MENHDTLQDIEKLVQGAVEDAKSFGITLDYSHESIEGVEKVLAAYHEKFKAGALTDQMANLIGTGYGCYVGETLIRQLGFGEWTVPKEGVTAGDWVVNIKGNHCLFPSKAVRRIKNGPEDNIITMYQITFNDFSDTKISLKVF